MTEAACSKTSFLEKLQSGQPLVTVELSPPKGTDTARLLRQAEQLKGRVDAINVPDCQLALLKMSSMATCKLIQEATGIETVWQLTCRDRNLLALQADIMGGYALGLRNILALTGDPVQLGDQKEVAKQVFHLDSVRLLDLLRYLNNGMDATATVLPNGGTRFAVGSALNPFRLHNRAQQLRLQQKLECGVDFFQTQPVYSLEPIAEMLEAVTAASAMVGCPTPVVMTGIIPPKSAEAARRMNHSVVGLNIPQSLIDLLERSEAPAIESLKFCADLVAKIQPLNPHFHFMPVGMFKYMPDLLEECFKGQRVNASESKVLS
ncbi:MAG: methylenetetrahydrofolate reductase [Vampirovibrionales bacterium]|nr:methylenetetrahydrofolate reductase [Vampirovibrionales bacterium]